MKKHINSKGVSIQVGDTINWRTASFKVARIYRDKLGIAKIETDNGVIFEANSIKGVER